MKDQQNKYEEIIKLISSTEPILENPGSLTEQVMSKVGRYQEHQRSPDIIIVLRPLLAAAAIFLLVLFIYQSTETNTNTSYKYSQSIDLKQNINVKYSEIILAEKGIDTKEKNLNKIPQLTYIMRFKENSSNKNRELKQKVIKSFIKYHNYNCLN